MNKKKNPKIAAVIDIGSNMLKMRISQLKKGEIVNLDRLEYPLHLGHEAFHDGKISFESLRELSSALPRRVAAPSQRPRKVRSGLFPPTGENSLRFLARPFPKSAFALSGAPF